MDQFKVVPNHVMSGQNEYGKKDLSDIPVVQPNPSQENILLRRTQRNIKPFFKSFYLQERAGRAEDIVFFNKLENQLFLRVSQLSGAVKCKISSSKIPLLLY